MSARIALAGLAAFVLLAPATASAATARDRAGDAEPQGARHHPRRGARLDRRRLRPGAARRQRREGARAAAPKVTVRLGDAVISTRGRSSRRAVDRHSGPGGRPIVIRSGRTLTFVLARLDGTKVKRAAIRTSGGDRASVKLAPDAAGAPLHALGAADPQAGRRARRAQRAHRGEGQRLPPRPAHPAPGGAPVREPQPPGGLPGPADARARRLRPRRPRRPRPPRPTSSPTPASPSRTAPRSPTPPRPARSASTAPARATPTGRSSSGSGGSAPATTSSRARSGRPRSRPATGSSGSRSPTTAARSTPSPSRSSSAAPASGRSRRQPIACPLTVDADGRHGRRPRALVGGAGLHRHARRPRRASARARPSPSRSSRRSPPATTSARRTRGAARSTRRRSSSRSPAARAAPRRRRSRRPGSSYGFGFSSGTSHRTPIGGSVISAEKACWLHGIGSASMPPRLPVSVPP